MRTTYRRVRSTLSSMSSSSSLSSSTKKRERAPPDAAKAEVDKGERKDARRAVEVPRRADGTLVFDDQPTFRPNLTPRQVIEQGAFGGSYWRPIKSGVTGQSYKDAHHEFPFFDGIEERLMSRTVADVKINRFGVKSGTTLEDWEAKSWIKAQGEPCAGGGINSVALTILHLVRPVWLVPVVLSLLQRPPVARR